MHAPLPSPALAAATSHWRAPQLSWRFWPVFLRNLLVWRKLAIPSLVGNIAEPLIWLVAFGYGMGMLVGDVSLPGPDGQVRAVPSPASATDSSQCSSRFSHQCLRVSA